MTHAIDPTGFPAFTNISPFKGTSPNVGIFPFNGFNN